MFTCVPPRLQGYIESLTAALKRLEGENEVLKQQQTDNHAMFAMLDGNQSTQVLQEKNSAIKAHQSCHRLRYRNSTVASNLRKVVLRVRDEVVQFSGWQFSLLCLA